MVWVLFWDDFEVNVNVCIHDFDDAKEESNKAATFASRLIQDWFNKQSLFFKISSRSSLALKQRVSKSCKALVIDYQEV